MRRTYVCWAIKCFDDDNEGFLANHADNGTGEMAPMLFRNEQDANDYDVGMTHWPGTDTEVVQVNVVVSEHDEEHD